MVFRSMALGMILSVVAVALASLTLLPAVLVALGDKVLVAKDHEDPDRHAEGRWARWTGLALSHPGRTLGAGLALLLLIAAPAIGMRLGMPKCTRGRRGSLKIVTATSCSRRPSAPAPSDRCSSPCPPPRRRTSSC